MSIDRETKTDYGVVKVSDDVISSIASIAAMEVEGVHKVGSLWTRGITELFSKKGASLGVRVDMKSDDDVDVTVPIIVRYGCNIPDISMLVQERVKRAIEGMTGVIPAEVNVNVTGVTAPDKKEKETAE